MVVLTISISPADRAYDTAAQRGAGNEYHRNLSKETRKLHIDLLGGRGGHLHDQRVPESSVDAVLVKLSKGNFLPAVT